MGLDPCLPAQPVNKPEQHLESKEGAEKEDIDSCKPRERDLQDDSYAFRSLHSMKDTVFVLDFLWVGEVFAG